MFFGKHFSSHKPASRAATAVAATPHFARRQQRRCSTELFSRRSQSSYPKLPSVSPRVLHIRCATEDDDIIIARDDDLIAPAASQPYMPEKWPDFSNMKVDPDVRRKFFNRKNECDMIIHHLKGDPTAALLLLGPKNSGKSVRHANLNST